LRKAFREQTARISTAVAEHFPPGTRLTRPAGGFILWVELADGLDSVELFRRAMKQQISFGPGVLFSASDRYRNCIRLGCAEPWSPRVEQAVARLGGLAKRLLA
jgi:DNA-binding transcriptional MocR family regulator